MSRIEGKVFEDFFRHNGTTAVIEVMINCVDNGSLARQEFLEQLKSLTKEIRYNVTEPTGLTYQNICEPYCDRNDAFYAFLSILDGNETKITYPVMELMGRQLFLAGNVYQATLNETTGTIVDFKTAIVRYQIAYGDAKVLKEWEKELVHLLYDSGKYPLLRCGAASDILVGEQVRAMGTKLAPYLAVSLVFLSVFLIISSMRHKTSEWKALEACLGAMIPVLSGLTTIGVVSATGLAFQSIIVSTLFLVLAIGIDDVFILLAAWHRTDKSLSIPERTAITVEEAGCSMTVTSITNLISFGNGVFSTTPVLQTFAIYSSVASVICYIYQLVIFSAILAISAPREYQKISDDGCLPAEIKSIKKLSTWHEKFWKTTAKAVESPLVWAGTLMILLAYWALSTYGIVTMETDLSIQKMAPSDARIVVFKNEYDRILEEMQTVGIIVKSPGDLRNRTRLDQLQHLIRDFETAKYSYGPASTMSFLKPYMDFLAFYQAEDEEEMEVKFDYVHLPFFLKAEPHFRGMLKLNQTACELDQPCLESFLFTTGFTTLVKYQEMFPLIEMWREISSKYSTFQPFSYTERSNFADQSHVMVNNIYQTVVSETVCMGISFLIFIPDTVSIIAALFSLFSVNVGVFGFLSLWGVGMDPVSTASLLLSIGFSVDIGAHISYHYYQAEAKTPRGKLEDAYLSIGWATIQGGLSTIIAMLPILFSPSYLAMVFLKTVILVCLFGLIHGLLVLPVFLSMFSTIFSKCSRNTEESKSHNLQKKF